MLNKKKVKIDFPDFIEIRFSKQKLTMNGKEFVNEDDLIEYLQQYPIEVVLEEKLPPNVHITYSPKGYLVKHGNDVFEVKCSSDANKDILLLQEICKLYKESDELELQKL